jgi:formate hydrogenlyase transcriptional activator
MESLVPVFGFWVSAMEGKRRAREIAFSWMLMCGVALFFRPPVSSLFGLALADSSEVQKSVLVIYMEEKAIPGQLIFDRSLRATFNRLSTDSIAFYTEYLDLTRFPEEDSRRSLYSFYRVKYAQRKFDLIIIAGSGAIIDTITFAREVFPDAPLIFCQVERSALANRTLGPGITGVLMKVEYQKTLDLALSLHPDTRRVAVIAGTSAKDKFFLAQAQEEFRKYEGKVEFTYLTDLSIKQLQREVSHLPEHTVIFYLAIFQDAAGQPFVPADALTLIARAANVPIYGIAETYLERGIVGGHVLSFEVQGVRVAEYGVRILRGEDPSNLSIIDRDTNVDMFNWRQLRRWGISEDKLPPGSIIRYRETSVWERYKWYIIGAIALIIIQTSLIAGLLIQRAKRRRAERQLEERLGFQALLSELSAAFVNLPVGDLDSQIEKWLRRLTEFLRADRSSIMEFSRDGTKLYFTHSYEVLKFQPMYWKVSADQFHWYKEQLHKGRALVLSKLLDDLPGEAKAERQYFLQIGSKSHLAIPLSIGGSSIGALTFDLVRSYRIWPAEFVQRSYLVGEVFANAIARKRSDESLKSSLTEIGELKNLLYSADVFLQDQIKITHDFNEFIGNSDALKRALSQIEQVAPTDTTVLLLGETGTGKDLAASAIHDHSARKDLPLVKINCSSLPATLIESELFGHEKGAFTGAQARKVGRFELANGGTIFLDEIGELPPELQPKLLRVLQEGEFDRLGGSQTIKVDVRVIAATNRNLKTAVEIGLFREDLWYRLNVFPITLPPLRQRKEDIQLLIGFFVDKFSRKVGRHIESVAPATLKELQNYDWPGNVRELSNVIERAVINTQGSVLVLADKLDIPQGNYPPSGGSQTLEAMEREFILQRLEQTNWKIEGIGGAADSLGINSSTLRNRMKKLGIQRPKSH